jgi:hypothetical protein
MSILYRGIRPLMSFDVNNPEHRKWFAEFVKYRTWGRCPVRFLSESLDQDLVSYIEGKMLGYYVEQEFSNAKQAKTKNTKKSKPKGSQSSVRRKQSVPAKTNQI